MEGAQLPHKNPSVCSCDGSSVLSPQLRSRSTYRKNEPTGSCEVTEHPPFGGWFLNSFLDRPKRGVVSCQTERTGPFPHAHDRVINITPKAECQELGELHTTARLKSPLRNQTVLNRPHLRSVARLFSPFLPTNMTPKFTTCFYAHGPAPPLLNRPLTSVSCSSR